ncbi:hypothetical protein [Dyadobacter aurulentus]|uniref:hypothetical protein n=1 Tax=Dyadobacter sp. UC 10 TaxID=2605428 RepID=UPI0011F2EAA9|nr:hypothetical protein [Dyadobacter sp. UC 10]KAA0992323.1 hypothetical protein FXO21_20125 [Dyadobacter sp. UC 10]
MKRFPEILAVMLPVIYICYVNFIAVEPRQQPAGLVADPDSYFACFVRDKKVVRTLRILVDQPVADVNFPFNPFNPSGYPAGRVYMQLSTEDEEGAVLTRTIAFYADSTNKAAHIVKMTRPLQSIDLTVGFQLDSAQFDLLVGYLSSLESRGSMQADRTGAGICIDILQTLNVKLPPGDLRTFWYDSTPPGSGQIVASSKISPYSLGKVFKKIDRAEMPINTNEGFIERPEEGECSPEEAI